MRAVALDQAELALGVAEKTRSSPSKRTGTGLLVTCWVDQMHEPRSGAADCPSACPARRASKSSFSALSICSSPTRVDPIRRPSQGEGESRLRRGHRAVECELCRSKTAKKPKSKAAREQSAPTRRATVPALEEILFTPLPVLDHGFVRVIDYMGDDAAVVQAARVSYGKGTKNVNEDRGLIQYLMRHRHTTPFEMCEIKYHVKLPIFVARQWIRHRTANVNEYSARYSILDNEFYLPGAGAARRAVDQQPPGPRRRAAAGRSRARARSLARGCRRALSRLRRDAQRGRERQGRRSTSARASRASSRA